MCTLAGNVTKWRAKNGSHRCNAKRLKKYVEQQIWSLLWGTKRTCHNVKYKVNFRTELTCCCLILVILQLPTTVAHTDPSLFDVVTASINLLLERILIYPSLLVNCFFLQHHSTLSICEGKYTACWEKIYHSWHMSSVHAEQITLR